MKKQIIAAALLAIVAGPAAAHGDFTVLSGFLTKHSRNGYNEANHGIGVRIDRGALAGWAVGTYHNSDWKQSVYVAREWTWKLAPRVSTGVFVAAVTGYEWAVTPAVLPEAIMHLGRVDVAVLAQPVDFGRRLPAFVAAQVRIRF